MYSTKSFGTYYDHRSFLFVPYVPPDFSPNEHANGPEVKRLFAGPTTTRLISGPKTEHLFSPRK